MATIGRNDPCPCGSGKKYKFCHGSNIILFPGGTTPKSEQTSGENPAARINRMILERLSAAGKNPDSSDLDSIISEISETENNRHMPEFFGLTPSQMHRILGRKFADNAEFIELVPKVTEEDPGHIPILRMTWYFLSRLGELAPIRATKNGNLPRAFVHDLFEGVYRDSEEGWLKVNKEEDSMLISTHRQVLSLAGLMKKRGNEFSLTETGKAVVREKAYSKLYEKLFLTWTDRFNWGYTDGYSEFSLIQSSPVFMLLLLKKAASDYTESEELGRLFIRAFPAVLNEARSQFSPPEEEVTSCFRT